MGHDRMGHMDLHGQQVSPPRGAEAHEYRLARHGIISGER